MSYRMSREQSESALLAGEHYAIIERRTIYIPGDERSRTNPGHGYPEHTEESISYRAYSDKDKWEAEIRILTARKTDFRAILAIPAQVTTSIQVDIRSPSKETSFKETSFGSRGGTQG